MTIFFLSKFIPRKLIFLHSNARLNFTLTYIDFLYACFQLFCTYNTFLLEELPKINERLRQNIPIDSFFPCILIERVTLSASKFASSYNIKRSFVVYIIFDLMCKTVHVRDISDTTRDTKKLFAHSRVTCSRLTQWWSVRAYCRLYLIYRAFLKCCRFKRASFLFLEI